MRPFPHARPAIALSVSPLTSPLTPIALLAVCIALACATSPLGRRQLLIYDDATMAEMGASSFDQIKSDMPVSKDAATNAYVRCVAEAILDAMGPRPGAPSQWEIVVFDEPMGHRVGRPGDEVHLGRGRRLGDRQRSRT